MKMLLLISVDYRSGCDLFPCEDIDKFLEDKAFPCNADKKSICPKAKQTAEKLSNRENYLSWFTGPTRL